MFHRISSWWRAPGVVLLSLATLTWPAAAHADPTTLTFSLLHQDAVTTLSSRGTARVALTLALPHGATGVRVRLTLFPRLVARGEITPLISGAGPSTQPRASTGALTVTCSVAKPVSIDLALFTGRPARTTSHCTNRAPRLRLPCRGSSCDGVYPLGITVLDGPAASTKWSMLVIRASHVLRRVHVAWISTLGPSAWRHPTRTSEVLDAIGAQSSLPLTVTADYRTLSAALNATSPTGLRWRAALTKSLDSPLHRVAAAPPNNIDFGGLVENNLATQVALQLTLSDQLLGSLNGRVVDGPVVLSGSPTVSDLDALAGSGVSEVVLPESDLSVAPSSTLTWGAPFHVLGAGSLRVLATDGPLDQLAVDNTIEPGRRATLTVATLAFLHFEEPNAPAPRTVVMTAPAALTSTRYLDDLFAQLAHNPFVSLTSLVPSFTSSLVGTNGSPATRTLSSLTRSTWTLRNVASLETLIGAVNSFAGSAPTATVTNALRVAMARAEIVGNPDARQNALNNASKLLSVQLDKFSIDPSAITLAGPGTALPITVFSRATYPLSAVIHLITNGLHFPGGRSVAVTLRSPTTSLRVPTISGRGSSVTLQVVLTTSNGQLVLARAAVQVHIAGASLVGYLLTLASLLVLALWWWRTHRRHSMGRHAR